MDSINIKIKIITSKPLTENQGCFFSGEGALAYE